MDQKKEKEGVVAAKDVAGTAVAVGAAAGQALLVDPRTAPAAVAMAAALVALFPPIIAAITEAGVRRMRARSDRFFESVVDRWAKDANMTAAEVAGLLEAGQADANVADAVWRAVRALLDAPNDEAAVPLGVLTAEYAREKRPADAFYRGTARLLAELSASELQELTNLLKWVLDQSSLSTCTIIARDVEITSGERSTWKKKPWEVSLRDGGEKSESLFPDHPTDADRLIFLLKTNGLARESSVRFFDYNPPTAEVERRLAERLTRILGGA